MNLRVAFKMAIKNLKLNKEIVVPFVISTSIMFILSGVLINMMMDNSMTSSGTLSMFIGFAMVLISFLTISFVLYANGFLFKKRAKEFSLYSVLGLEKRHVRRVIFIEQVIMLFSVSIISIFGTLALSRLTYVLSLKIMNIEIEKAYSFHQSPIPYFIIILGILAIFLVLWGVNSIKISKTSAINLMSYSKRAESEPKSRYILGIVGILGLAYGYYIALTQEGSLKSLTMFFKAAFIVVIAIYLIFIATSILILKRMKSNKRYFYRPKNFLTVSGMIFRVKSNATGLASITVLCSCVMVALSATISAYRSMETSINSQFPMEYKVDFQDNFSLKSNLGDLKSFDGKKIQFEKMLSKAGQKPKDITIVPDYSVTMVKDNNKLNLLGDSRISSDQSPIYITITTLDTFNQINKSDLKWNGKMMYTSNQGYLKNKGNININGENYSLKFLDKFESRNNLSVDNINIIVKDYDMLADFGRKIGTDKSSEKEYYLMRMMAMWNVASPSQSYSNRVDKIVKDYNKTTSDGKEKLIFQSKEEIRKMSYELYGGILIFGISVSIVFVIGSVLIIYYKQLSEAYEDRERYQIMKKVGLSNDLIKKTMKSQIISMFFLPIVVSIVNLLISSKIVFELLGILGITKYYQYGINELIVGISFTVFYYIVFKITSKVYYRSIS